MFVNTDYLNYHYFVSASDNFIVLSNKRNINGTWDHPETYNVIYQYLYPSYLTIETTRTTSQDLTFDTIDVTDNFYDRADCSLILTAVFFIVILIFFVINQVTEFIVKGGLMK